jgi:hypothetical protein
MTSAPIVISACLLQPIAAIDDGIRAARHTPTMMAIIGNM